MSNTTYAPQLRDLTDAEYEVADRIEEFLEAAAPRTTWTPSEITYRVKAPMCSNQVRNILSWMVERQYVSSEGNGVRTRFFARSN